MIDARIRGNNLGNIEQSSRYTWKGEIRPNSGRFADFVSLEYSIRAMFKDMRNKIAAGKNTIQKIISAWCPPPPGGDCKNTLPYIQFVADRSGISSSKIISSGDRETLSRMVKAMGTMEHGVTAPDNIILLGWNLQNSSESPPLPAPGSGVVVAATEKNEPKGETNKNLPLYIIGGGILVGAILKHKKII